MNKVTEWMGAGLPRKRKQWTSTKYKISRVYVGEDGCIQQGKLQVV